MFITNNKCMWEASVVFKWNGVETIIKDIKRLDIDEQSYLRSINSCMWADYTSLWQIPDFLLPDLIHATRWLLMHIIALNTIIKDVWVENIWPDFKFGSTNTSNFSRKIASTNEITSEIVIAYVKNQRGYIESLLVNDIEKKAA